VTPERWAQIEELFHRAAESDPAARQELLDQACSSDSELRKEVEALLSCDGRAAAKMEAGVRSELQNIGFPLTGKTVSHYQILGGLGGGGMGLVYRAQDVKLSRKVALKFLHEESANNPDALRRFEREARSASALEHANICPIYEFGEHAGQPFIVMPLLEGQTVEQFIHTQRAPKGSQQIRKLLDVSVQVLKGLGVAHEHGIAHRDIKPGNIFLTSGGEAKILDFGVAKLTEMEEQRDRPADGETETVTLAKGPDFTLSRTGAVVGTAAYMSPEQVRGDRVDSRTDIFSFGLVLYELATGKRAFGGTTWPVLREAVLRGTPKPVRGLNPEVPTKLEAVIKKALEKNRDTRYQTASEMRADLENLQRQLAPRRLPRRWAAAAGSVVVLLIVGAIFWFAKHRPSLSQGLPDLKLRQLTMNSAEIPVKTGAISPDGEYLAYTDIKGMHIKLLKTGENHLVPKPEGFERDPVEWEITSTAWFPDSIRFLANSHPVTEGPSGWSSQTTSAWLVSILGGAPRKLRDKAVAWSVSPDGSSISFGTNQGKLGEREIWLMSPSGENANRLYESAADSAICCLSFFPDGQRVSYVTSDSSGGDSLVTRDLKGGPIATLLRDSDIKKMGDGVLLPDGRLIYSDPCNGLIMRSDNPCNYWIMRLDVHAGGIVEKPRRLSNWVGVWMNEPSATADGKRVAFLQSSGRGTGYLADLEASGRRFVNSRRFPLEEGGDDYAAAWTSDSKSVIVATNRGDNYSVYKQFLDSDAQQPIVTTAGFLLENVQVSPDNRWVLLQVWPLGGRIDETHLMRVPITGGVPEPMFPIPDGSICFCSSSPSGVCAVAEPSEDRKQMVITSVDAIKGRGTELARVDLDPDYETPLWGVSPDGTRIAAASGPRSPIKIKSLRGGRTQTIHTRDLDHIQALTWAADARGLIVTVKDEPRAKIVYVDLAGKTQHLWDCSSDRCFAGESPDGHHLTIYEWRQTTNVWMMENF